MAKTKLKDLEVTEVSLVDAGANQHAHVTLYKRNGGKPEEQPTGQNPEQAPAKSGLHKFFSAIGKALKLDQADIDSAVADIEKADTFNDKMEERKLRRITDEIWDVCFALEKKDVEACQAGRTGKHNAPVRHGSEHDGRTVKVGNAEPRRILAETVRTAEKRVRS